MKPRRMMRQLYIDGITQVKAYRILQADVGAVVREHGLGSVSEWFVLSHVYLHGPIMAKDLAVLLDVEAPLITRLVANLNEIGLVATVEHDSDKRAKIISSTAKAGQLVPRIQADLEAKLAASLKGVSRADLESYQRVLRAIIANSAKQLA